MNIHCSANLALYLSSFCVQNDRIKEVTLPWACYIVYKSFGWFSCCTGVVTIFRTTILPAHIGHRGHFSWLQIASSRYYKYNGQWHAANGLPITLDLSNRTWSALGCISRFPSFLHCRSIWPLQLLSEPHKAQKHKATKTRKEVLMSLVLSWLWRCLGPLVIVSKAAKKVQ